MLISGAGTSLEASKLPAMDTSERHADDAVADEPASGDLVRRPGPEDARRPERAGDPRHDTQCPSGGLRSYVQFGLSGSSYQSNAQASQGSFSPSKSWRRNVGCSCLPRATNRQESHELGFSRSCRRTLARETLRHRKRCSECSARLRSCTG